MVPIIKSFDRTVEYMEDVNEKIASYAERLNAPFSIYIEPENLSFMVQHPDKLEPAFQLSGGQAMIASWMFHLAMYEKHGSGFGFIGMDEPTDSLDDANIRNVAEVIDYLNTYCAGVGLQFIMVTHEDQIASSFSNTIMM